MAVDKRAKALAAISREPGERESYPQPGPKPIQPTAGHAFPAQRIPGCTIWGYCVCAALRDRHPELMGEDADLYACRKARKD